jgi:uncharacterized protein YndB with AHSA1/START domain
MADQRSGINAGDIREFATTAADEPRGFAASASRTISADVERVYAAWTDERKRRQWLRNDELEVTDLTPSISLHGKWAASSLRVFFMPRGPFRTHVTVDQEELSTGRKAEQMRKFWQARLGRLAATLEHSRA